MSNWNDSKTYHQFVIRVPTLFDISQGYNTFH